jgi:hypothetical protein
LTIVRLTLAQLRKEHPTQGITRCGHPNGSGKKPAVIFLDSCTANLPEGNCAIFIDIVSTKQRSVPGTPIASHQATTLNGPGCPGLSVACRQIMHYGCEPRIWNSAISFPPSLYLEILNDFQPSNHSAWYRIILSGNFRKGGVTIPTTTRPSRVRLSLTSPRSVKVRSR